MSALVQRVVAARERCQANGVTATTFFHDPAGRPWKDADGFRDAFNELRDRLTKKHASFETRYYVGVDPGGAPESHISTRATDSPCSFSLWITTEQP